MPQVKDEFLGIDPPGYTLTMRSFFPLAFKSAEILQFYDETICEA